MPVMRPQGKAGLIFVSGCSFPFRTTVMQIHFNGTAAEIAENYSLQDLLRDKGLHETKGIAVAINELVIPRKDWPAVTLNSNDSILVIKAAQGG
jgi:sulfur carrier protein